MADINNINVNGTTYNIVDDEAMRLASNPTNNNILVTNANGQAVDSGVSISGIGGSGTTIYDDSVAYDELTFETVGSGADTVKVGIDMDLLWTNSSLTSSFGAQTINVEYGEYKMLVFTMHYFTGTSGHDLLTNVVPVNIGDNFWIGGVRAGNVDTLSRQITLTSPSSITIGDGRSGSNVNNAFAIPYQIYGIR